MIEAHNHRVGRLKSRDGPDTPIYVIATKQNAKILGPDTFLSFETVITMFFLIISYLQVARTSRESVIQISTKLCKLSTLISSFRH